jgi:hypothetical protein
MICWPLTLLTLTAVSDWLPSPLAMSCRSGGQPLHLPEHPAMAAAKATSAPRRIELLTGRALLFTSDDRYIEEHIPCQ